LEESLLLAEQWKMVERNGQGIRKLLRFSKQENVIMKICRDKKFVKYKMQQLNNGESTLF
jgi:hypothetical protein